MKRRLFPILGALALLTIIPCKNLKAETIEVSADSGANASVISKDGQCTLIEAMLNAHYNNYYMGLTTDCKKGTGEDTVVLPAGAYTFTKIFSPNIVDAIPAVAEKLTIQGAGAKETVIQREENSANYFRLLNTSATGNLILQGVTVKNGSLDGNYGAAIFNAGTLQLLDSMITNNQSNKEGGAIYNNKGTVLVQNSTIYKNTTEARGAGLYNKEGTVMVINSTFSENQATGASSYGGGIYSEKGTVTISSSSFVKNSATLDGGALNRNSSAVFFVQNSLFSQNTPHHCNTALDSTGFYNLENGDSCGFDAAQGDQINTDPLTGPLQDNGGPTLTHALVKGSPAVDHADPQGCFNGPFAQKIEKDQRGAARHVGPACDIGAYEKGSCGDAFLEPEEACDGGADCTAQCQKNNSVAPDSGEDTGGPDNNTDTSGHGASSSGCSLTKSNAGSRGAFQWLPLSPFMILWSLRAFKKVPLAK